MSFFTMFHPLIGLGLADPQVERARVLAGVTPRVPFVALDSLESVVPLRDPDKPLSERALHKYRSQTEGMYVKGRPATYVNRGSDGYRSGDLPRLASVLVHENAHVLGAGEPQAYAQQAEALARLGYDRTSPYFRGVAGQAERDAVLRLLKDSPKR